MGLLDTLTGGESGAAQTDLQNALAAIQQVQTPTIESMQYQLQQLVQAGVLTPEKAQFYLANPSAYATEVIPQLGTQAQESSIGLLESDAAAGGLGAIDEAKMQDIIRELNTQEAGQRGAIEQNAAARGDLTGGEVLASELQGNQSDEANANQMALGTAANAENMRLAELTSAGSLGAGLQGQENTQANTVAGAVDAINKFNAAQEQGTENFNVTNANEAQAANLANEQAISSGNVEAANAKAAQQAQLPQEVYQDALAKAQAEAGIGEAQAGQATQQGQQLLNLEGGAVAAGTGALADAYAPVPITNINMPASGAATAAAPVATASEGGMIHKYLSGGDVEADDESEKARVHGDSPKNDRIPALLSEKEIVLPRTVAEPAMRGNTDPVMDFLSRMRAKKAPTTAPVHPHDIKSLLDGMALRRSANA